MKVQILDYWNNFKSLEVPILVCLNNSKNMEVQILDIWTIFENMMVKSMISTQIQDWVQIVIFEMIYLVVPQVFDKHHNYKGDADTQSRTAN